MNIVFIGLRGSGKSTLGRTLATRLNLPFVDLDEFTPQVLGKSTVAEAFVACGQAEFRRAEMVALRQSLSTDNLVIALGGGTPTAPGAEQFLRDAKRKGMANIVYLRASVGELRTRLASTSNAHRPSLTGKDPLDEIEEVMQGRDALYRSLADLVLEVDGQPPKITMASIIAALNLSSGR